MLTIDTFDMQIVPGNLIAQQTGGSWLLSASRLNQSLDKSRLSCYKKMPAPLVPADDYAMLASKQPDSDADQTRKPAGLRGRKRRVSGFKATPKTPRPLT